MKKQLAIVIVAILLTAVLLVPPVMAFALWDGNSVQYSSHWGYNSITDKSVTASNQSIAIGNGIGERESSSRLKYYRAPVPVRTSNWPAIVMGTGIRECKSISKVSADAVLNDSSTSMNEKPATNLDGPEGRVPGKITEGVIEGVPKGKIIKGTPENPEQVILYVKTADGKLHPLNVTIRVLDGYNSITDKSVTASNQSIAIGNGIGERESSSRLKYYRAPVPVRTSNWSAIAMGTGIRGVRGISWNSADGIRMNISENFANEIKEMDNNIVIGEAPTPIKLNMRDLLNEIKEMDSNIVIGGAPTPIKLNMRDLLNGTKTLLP